MPTSDIERLEPQAVTAEAPNHADLAARALLLALVQQPSKAETRNIYQLAEKVGDWGLFLSLAEEHRVSPMAYLRLRENGAAVPLAVEARLRAGYEGNALQCVINAAELIAILSALNREAIPAIPYKGIVLAASVYNDMTARPAGDLDLLVHEQHLAQASEVLFARGFTRLTHIDANGVPLAENLHEYQFERPSDGMQLELRWKLDLGHPGFKRNLGMEWMWPSHRVVKLAGADVPDLNPEIALLMLCMHGSKHGWSRLMWVCDVAQLLLSFPTLDWSRVIREGKTSGLSRTLTLGVLLAHQVVGTTVPENILRGFVSDGPMSTLARDIEAALFDFNSINRIDRPGYKFQLMAFSDRVRYLCSLEPLRPNDSDRALISLPKSLESIYYLVRPFRILRDRLRR